MEEYAREPGPFRLVLLAVPNVEDMIDRIKRVLSIPKPYRRRGWNRIDQAVHRACLARFEGFGFRTGASPESIRSGSSLPELTPEQWNKLAPVGTVSSPPLVFARGRASLTESSQLVFG